MVSAKKLVIGLSAWIIAAICLTFLVLGTIQLSDLATGQNQLDLGFHYYYKEYFWPSFGVSMVISALLVYLLMRFFEKKGLSPKKMIVYLVAWPITALIIDFLILLAFAGIIVGITINIKGSSTADVWSPVFSNYWQLFGLFFLITPILFYAIKEIIDYY